MNLPTVFSITRKCKKCGLTRNPLIWKQGPCCRKTETDPNVFNGLFMNSWPSHPCVLFVVLWSAVWEQGQSSGHWLFVLGQEVRSNYPCSHKLNMSMYAKELKSGVQSYREYFVAELHYWLKYAFSFWVQTLINSHIVCIFVA